MIYEQLPISRTNDARRIIDTILKRAQALLNFVSRKFLRGVVTFWAILPEKSTKVIFRYFIVEFKYLKKKS